MLTGSAFGYRDSTVSYSAFVIGCSNSICSVSVRRYFVHAV
nr:MAG TPA: hypothetical protein [Caudoviricetes sp.]